MFYFRCKLVLKKKKKKIRRRKQAQSPEGPHGHQSPQAHTLLSYPHARFLLKGALIKFTLESLL
jgi:hypothetical protein